MDWKICFQIILVLEIMMSTSGEDSSSAENTKIAKLSIETILDNLKSPHLPWFAISDLLTSIGKGRTVVMFINETLGMPSDLLDNILKSSTRLLLTSCNRVEHLSSFLRELEKTCTNYCILMVQCNMSVAQRLINNSVDYKLFRPWTLWIFMDPKAITFLDYIQFQWTGVAIGVPACDNYSAMASLNNEENCSNYTTVDIYVRNNTENQLLATFPPSASNLSETGSEMKQAVRLAQESFDSTFDRLLNLQNTTIKVAAYELPPILSIKNNTNSTGLSYGGICIKIMEQFAKSMNFQYELVRYLEIGTKIPNETHVKWSGMIGDVRDRNIDLAIGALSLTEDRLEAVDFTESFLEDYSSIMYNVPQQRSRILIFIKVFPWQVWLMLLLAILLLGPIFTLLEKMMFIENGNVSTMRTTVWESWWILLTSTVQKGEVSPAGVPGRALATFWLLFLLVLVGTYSGMLLATMSFPGYVTTYEYLRQFKDTSAPFPIILKPSSTYTNIKEAETPAASIIQERWRKGPYVVFPETPDEVPSYLATGNYAFLSERLICQQIIFDQMQKCNCCPYYVAKNDFLTQYYSFMVPKNSPLSTSMNIILRRLFQAGITQQWLKQSMPKTARCQDMQTPASSNVLNAMDLADIQGAFYTLGIGLITSLIALFVEMCCKNRISKLTN